MTNSFLTAASIIIVFATCLILGYVIAKRNRLLGVAFAMCGLSLGVILTVNYYVEVPWSLFFGTFTVTIVVGLISAFEVARKSAVK